MERRFSLLKEYLNLKKPEYITELEVEMTRISSAITFGSRHNTILNEKDSYGILVHHPGPEIKVIPGFPLAKVTFTGNESVFIEFMEKDESFHITGRVTPEKKFEFTGLEKYHPKKGYRPIRLQSHQQVIMHALGILKKIY